MTLIGVLGFALLALGVFILWQANRSKNNPIDFADILIDSGRTSLRKLGELIALLASTWIIVALVVNDKLTPEYYGLYIGAWVARTLLGQLTQAKAAQMDK